MTCPNCGHTDDEARYSDDDLEALAKELFDKLASYRWPPPNPKQVEGLIHSYLERVRDGLR